MAFVSAMSSNETHKKGVNGADVYTEDGVGDHRVTLFTMLNRDLDKSYIEESIKKIMKENKSDEIMLDLFLIAFHTRDVRGGKGERDLFYHIMTILFRYAPDETKRMCKLVPEYGCWCDMWELLLKEPQLGYMIFPIVCRQFIDDLAKASVGERVSLLGKWLPREKSKSYPSIAYRLAEVLYSHETSKKKRMMIYRKETSFLNRTLQTCEVDMCGGTWRNIEPSHIPGRSLKIHRKAFLNESNDATGELRYPECDDRMKCREQMLSYIEELKNGTKKAHGANVIMPHEVVVSIQDRMLSKDQETILQAQWESIREETMRLGGLHKAVVMCDFSGSMNGLPLQISQALGILISEITHPAFRDHMLTFDAKPTWHSLVTYKSLKEKVNSLRSVGQGLNTDFYQACQLIIRNMVDHCVPVEEAPEDLIVITDMGFDAAAQGNYAGRSEVLIARIRSEFHKEGERLWGKGKGWKAPRIVIWNVRADYNDFHATAEEEGIVQLSGWSPSILKALQKDGVKTTTPYEAMRVALDDPRYDKVRDLWSEMIAFKA